MEASLAALEVVWWKFSNNLLFSANCKGNSVPWPIQKSSDAQINCSTFLSRAFIQQPEQGAARAAGPAWVSCWKQPYRETGVLGLFLLQRRGSWSEKWYAYRMKGRGQRQEDKVIIQNGATTDVVMIEAKWGISFIGLSHLDVIRVNSVLICKDRSSLWFLFQFAF